MGRFDRTAKGRSKGDFKIMEYLFIYSLHLANLTSCITVLSFILSLITGFFYVIFKFDAFDDTDGKAAAHIKPYLITFTITAILFSLFPTRKILVLMGGTYLGKKVAKQAITSQKLEKVNTIIDLQLDKYIKELQAENKN